MTDLKVACEFLGIPQWEHCDAPYGVDNTPDQRCRKCGAGLSHRDSWDHHYRVTLTAELAMRMLRELATNNQFAVLDLRYGMAYASTYNPSGGSPIKARDIDPAQAIVKAVAELARQSAR